MRDNAIGLSAAQQESVISFTPAVPASSLFLDLLGSCVRIFRQKKVETTRNGGNPVSAL